MSLRIWLAEFIGTFALVFAGVAALASSASNLGVALAFGLSVSIMIAAVGPLSFAHFNPAVTVGFWIMRRITLRDLFLYWSAELSGAVAAMLILQVSFGPERLRLVNHGVTALAPEVTVLQGFILETVLTFFLMFVIATCVIQEQALAAVYIGWAVALGALAGGALTGASMNPARSLAPALFGGVWAHHWLYWLAPIAGASLAARTASYLWPNPDLEEGRTPPLQQTGD